MPVNTDLLNSIISGLNSLPKKSEIDTADNDIDLLATETTHGLMSYTDKSKLNKIDEGANAYTHPTDSGYRHIPSGGSSGQILKWSSDGTAKWDKETTYGLVTTTTNGLMSYTDKVNLDNAVSKLSNIESGANKYILPTAGVNTLGGVKTTSSVTSSTGYIACPIIDGVPYYQGITELPIASTTTIGGVKTTSSVTSTEGLTPVPIINGVPYYPSSLPANGGTANYATSAGSAPANGGNADTVDGVHLAAVNDASTTHWLAAWSTTGLIHAIDTGRAYVGNAGNANTVGGISNGYYLGTLNSSGGGHGARHRIQCKYNVHGDRRFKFITEDGAHEVRCDYATKALQVDNLRTGTIYFDAFSTSLTAYHECWGKWCVVTGNGLDSASTAADYVPNSPYKNSAIWFEVLTTGTGNRAFQLAIGCYTHQRHMFIRYMHDAVWSGWYKINTTAV